MDDGADVGWLRTEDLCGLNTFMNTINSQKFQPFRNPESFKTKFTSAKSAYHFNTKKQCAKNAFCFFLFGNYLKFQKNHLQTAKSFHCRLRIVSNYRREEPCSELPSLLASCHYLNDIEKNTPLMNEGAGGVDAGIARFPAFLYSESLQNGSINT